MKTSDNKNLDNHWSLHAKNRARLASIGIAIWAILIILEFNMRPEFNATIIFYALLLLNTFFSVRIFATITPQNHVGQKMWDSLLALCLIILPLFFNAPIIFVFITLILFVVATLKYIFLIPVVGFSKLLLDKIRVDTLGVLLCILCLPGVIMGYIYVSLDIWVSIFFLSNIYVLWHTPLYRLDHHSENPSNK